MYTQACIYLFIQVTTHLNSILSLWISWWANAPRLKTKSSTVNLSWWRDQIKKNKHVLIHPFSKKKNRGAKTPKKLPETLKRRRSGPISSGHQGARVLSCWCKYLKASEISRKTLILPTTPGWILENDLLKFYIELFTEPKRSHQIFIKITVLPLLRRHQHLKRLCDSKPVTLLVLL